MINCFILVLAETKITPGANSARMLIWNAYGDTSFDEHNEPMNVTLAARFQDDEGEFCHVPVICSTVDCEPVY